MSTFTRKTLSSRTSTTRYAKRRRDFILKTHPLKKKSTGERFDIQSVVNLTPETPDKKDR